MKDNKRLSRRNSRRCTQIINYVHSENYNTNNNEQKINEVTNQVDINNALQNASQSHLSSFQISLNFFKELEKRNKEEEKRYLNQQSKLKNNVIRKCIQNPNNDDLISNNSADTKEHDCGIKSLKNSIVKLEDDNQSSITSLDDYAKKIFSFNIEASISDPMDSNDIDRISYNDSGTDIKLIDEIYLRDEEIERIIDESFNEPNDGLNQTKNKAKSNDKVEIPERLFSFKNLQKLFK